MEFFVQNEEGETIANPINQVNIPGNSAEDQLFKFLLARIKDNRRIFDLLNDAGVVDVTDITHIYLEEWKKILSFMQPMSQKILLRLYKNYIDEITDQEVKQQQMQIWDELNRMPLNGGKKKRRTKRNKKYSKKGGKKTYRKY
jgi:hypothetical protein